jgi:hypothetical protein
MRGEGCGDVIEITVRINCTEATLQCSCQTTTVQLQFRSLSLRLRDEDYEWICSAFKRVQCLLSDH